MEIIDAKVITQDEYYVGKLPGVFSPACRGNVWNAGQSGKSQFQEVSSIHYYPSVQATLEKCFLLHKTRKLFPPPWCNSKMWVDFPFLNFREMPPASPHPQI